MMLSIWTISGHCIHCKGLLRHYSNYQLPTVFPFVLLPISPSNSFRDWFSFQCQHPASQSPQCMVGINTTFVCDIIEDPATASATINKAVLLDICKNAFNGNLFLRNRGSFLQTIAALPGMERARLYNAQLPGWENGSFYTGHLIFADKGVKSSQ